MKTLIEQTKTDIRAGQQSWRVMAFGSFFSLLSTIVYLAILNA